MRTPRPASQCLLSRADSHLGAKAWRMLGVGFPPPVRRGGFSGRCGPEPLLPAFSRSGSPLPRRGDEGFLREAHAVGSALPRLDRVCVYFDLQSLLEPLAKGKQAPPFSSSVRSAPGGTALPMEDSLVLLST